MNLQQHSNSPETRPEETSQFVESLPLFLKAAGLQKSPNGNSPRFAIKVKGKILFMNLGDVVSVHAEDNYVLLQRQSGSHLLRESISGVAEKLEHYGFVRIHRSVLVNASFVEEIRPMPTGEYGLRVKGGKEYTVTRTYKKNLRSLAEFWIGSCALFQD